MALLCLRDNISRAVSACSATSMHWITCNYKKTRKLVNKFLNHFVKIIIFINTWTVSQYQDIYANAAALLAVIKLANLSLDQLYSYFKSYQFV